MLATGRTGALGREILCKQLYKSSFKRLLHAFTGMGTDGPVELTGMGTDEEGQGEGEGGN